MTEAEALDEAARAAGWRDWKTLQLIARPDKQDDIRRHAATLIENAALKAENERLRRALENIGNLSLNGCIKVNTALGQWIGTPDAYAREVLGMPWRSAALGEK